MKQLLILSGKGGTGKTTVAGALIRLANAKTYADCDVDAPNLHLAMNWTDKPQKTDFYGMPKAEINQALCAKCGLCMQYCRFDAIHEDAARYRIDPYSCEGCGVCEAMCSFHAIRIKPAVSGELMLHIGGGTVFSTARLKMGSGASGKLVTEVKRQMRQFSSASDIAIIDGSPGIGCPVIASMSSVDMVLVVAEPSVSGISDMERIIRTAGKFQTKTVVCINKYNLHAENTRKIEEFCRERRIRLAGKIPFDPDAAKAINHGLSIVDVDCRAGHAIIDVFHHVFQILNESEVKIIP